MKKNDSINSIHPHQSKFLGLLSSSQTRTLYSIILLSISLATLANLPSSSSSLLEREYEEGEEEEDVLNSRIVLELLLVCSKLMAQTSLISSLLSLTGTILLRSVLQIPLKLQALINLFMNSFSLVVFGTLYLSPSLLNSASHELCLFALRSDSLSSLSRVPDYSSAPPSAMSASQSFAYSLWPTNLSGENCDERASSIVLPALIFLIICNLIHLHLIHVLFSTQSPVSPILPLHQLPQPNPKSKQQHHQLPRPSTLCSIPRPPPCYSDLDLEKDLIIL